MYGFETCGLSRQVRNLIIYLQFSISCSSICARAQVAVQPRLYSFSEMATSSSEAKLRKLNDIRRKLPHMTASAMSALLDECTHHGIPELHSRHDMGKSTQAEIARHASYGTLLPNTILVDKQGAEANMLMINPLSLLQAAFGQGGSYTELVMDTLRKHPNSPDQPWALAVYCDEVVPGNVISHDNKRKVWVGYASFLEFGQINLSREEAWLPTLVQRTAAVDKLSAGISQAFGAMLKQWFCNPSSDIAAGGLVLKHPDGSQLRLFIKLGMMLQDGGAHKHVFHVKGDGGTKFCHLCRNLFAITTAVADEETGETLLAASLIFEHELDFATDSDIRGTMARLVAKRAVMTAGEFAIWEKCVGFNYEPHGLLFDNELESIVLPVSHYCHDWMHCMLVNGVFNTVLYLMLYSLKAAKFLGGHIYPHLYNYISLWTLPNSKHGSGLQDIFNSKREESNTKAKKFKCQASEGLGLYPILAYFIQAVVLPANACVRECVAFLAMADILDMLQAVPLQKVTPQDLRAVIHTFLQSCVAAEWKQYMHPKFHWLVHFPTHLEKFGMLPTCFVHERKHRVAKRYANHIQNTQGFEKSVLSELVCHDLAVLKTSGIFDSAVKLSTPHTASKKLREFMSQQLSVSLQAEECLTCAVAHILPAGTCCKKDVVLIKSSKGTQPFEAAEVWFHVQCKGICVSLVSLWKLKSYDAAKGLAEWLKQDNPVMISTSSILAPVCFTVSHDTAVRTLIPFQFR